MTTGESFSDDQRENETSLGVQLDRFGLDLDFTPRHGLVWPRSGVAAVKLLSDVHKYREISAVSLKAETSNIGGSILI